MPMISIVIPLYNYENYIVNCLTSCLKQTINDYDIIVTDDCSTDDSANIVDRISQKHKKVKLIRLDKNQGYSKAKNESIISSSSKYIVHLDSDDYLVPNSLELRLTSFSDQDIMMVHGKVYSFYDDKTYDWCIQNMASLSFIEANPHAQGVMVKRECYEKYGLYDENLRSKSDREMWIRLRDLSRIKIKAISDYVAFYRIHPNSMIQYRSKNPKHNEKIEYKCFEAVRERRRNGINQYNTRFIT